MKNLIISIVAEKVFGKIQPSFIIETLTQVGVKETYLNIMKAINSKPTANVIVNSRKVESLFAKFKDKTRMPSLTSCIQHNIGRTHLSNQTIKRIQSIQIGREEVKLCYL